MLKTLNMGIVSEGGEKGENNILEENELNPERKMEVIQELIAVVESVCSIGDYRRTHKKEASSLVRRLKLLLPLLEEIRDAEDDIPETGMICLCNLKKAFVFAKNLLNTCHGASKIYLALESEDIMNRFHSVYDKWSQALEGMPYAEIGISEEVREQIELMRMQLRRAKMRTDTQDMELAMDMMVVLSTKDERNTDNASVKRLANKLSLTTVEELKQETEDVDKLFKERGQNAEGNKDIMEVLNKCKRIAGINESGVVEEPGKSGNHKKSPSLAIPHEFLCPITLEIMIDPVIVATGQTYERESIQRWLDSDHQTCPKTGQLLAHLSLAPNFALKNLITQWCEKNNFPLSKKDVPTTSNSSTAVPSDEVSSLVEKLSSTQLEVQRKAVRKIHKLSKESPESRILIANSGGITPLVNLLSYPDSRIQEHAVTALLNLSIEESNKKLISTEEPIPAIIEILQTGTVVAKENSAATLFSLSMVDQNKAIIGSSNGIPPLVELLRNGTIRGKKDAVTALFSLSLTQPNKTMAIEAGIVEPVIKLIKDRNLEMVDESLSLLLLLASNSNGRKEMGQLPVIEMLVGFIKDGSPKNKECAAAVLLELCSHNSNLMLAALQYGAYDYIVDLTKNGTNRGQRKGHSLLQVIKKSEQL